MNDNIRAAIIEGSKSLTPGMADDIERALQAQKLAIKQANAKEEINRKAKLQNEVAVQKQIAGISVPKESAYGEVDIANQMKGLVSTLTADSLAIMQGTATDEQVKRNVALDNYFTNMGETFGTMSYVADEFIKTKNTKGTDGKQEGSIDLSSLDPRFSELINVLDPNSTAEGNVSLDVSYKDGKVQTYQVVKSEAIREENRRLYESEEDPELKKQYLDENGEISDTYKLSYDEIKNFVNNKNNNTYLVGNQFSTVPGVSSVVDYAKTNEIIDKDGSPKADYMSQAPFQKTITQNGRRVVVDVTRPEVNKIAGALKAESNALTRLMFGGGENSAYASFVKANFDKFKGSTIDKDGNIMVTLLKRNEAGDYEIDENGNYIPEDSPTEIGSSSLSGGRFNMRTGVGNENLGMTKEDFDKANRFTQDVAMMNLNLNGASKERINTTATNALNPPRSEEASLVSNVISSNYDLLTGGDIDEIDFSTLNGLKGYQFEQAEEDPFTLLVYGTPTKDGRKVLQEVDLRNPSNAERVLLNIIDPDSKGIINPQTKTKLPSIVTDLTDPVNNFKENITEENFMDSLSSDYLKKMSQLGIGLEETSFNSDVILMTKPNGEEVEVDLEKDGWKDVFERNMKGAILMSPSYKQFISKPKNQEGSEDGKPTLDLLSFYNKLKKSESSNDTTASRVNKSGERYVGELQFGEARLNDYKNATGASFDLDEFQGSPSLQAKVGLWHIGDIDRYIDQLGDLAEGYDRNGLRAITHLGGKEGMKKWLESKGKVNPSDELGTSLTKYYNKFSK